jgi:GntR family transcriptional regulator/MocR family aminotransferase
VDLHVTLAGRGDLSARIYRQLLDAVMDGRLRPGERLPPTRELAQRLAVSRNTVAVAYDRLTAEGFLVGRVGAGTFVHETATSGVRGRAAPTGRDVRPRRWWRTPPPPANTWRRLVANELRAPDAYSAHYLDPAGDPGLRAAIARHIGVSRWVHAGPDDVLVTQGAQQALDLIGRVTIEPGTCVTIEEPGYPQARLLFESLGARVVGVPVDAEGLDVTALPRTARLVYTTPSHQYPLGMPMSLARRTALLDWAGRHGALVVEDDYDSEFRFSERPLEPLQSLDRSGRVVYVGSFAKTTLPMLRLGFLVAPESLRQALRGARQLADWHGDPITQAAMARFIDEGLLARHIRRATREYAARHDRITAALARDFTDWLRVVPSAAGLHLCAHATGTSDDLDRVLALAADAGVGVGALAGSDGGAPARPGVVIGYGAVDPTLIDEGMAVLAASFRAVDPT